MLVLNSLATLPCQVPFPFHIPPAQHKISLFSFIAFGINFARARLPPRTQL
jgi:hypothetical protein